MTINNNSIVSSRVTEWEYPEWSLTNTRENRTGNVQEKVHWYKFLNYNFKYQDKTDVNFLDMIKYYKFNSKSMCFFAVKQN